MPKTAFKQLKDRALTTLALLANAGDLTVTLAAGGGALFPSPIVNGFYVTIENEQLVVTAVNTNAVSIVSSTNATPINIQATGHGLNTNDTCTIAGHLVNTNANGVWTVTKVDANNFTLNGSVGNGVGGATGTVTGDIFTVTRGQNGTTAASHAIGTAVEQRIIAQTTVNLQTATNNLEDGKGNSFQTKAIMLVTDTIPNTSRIVKLNNTTAGSITLTSAPTIPDGIDGQRITLINISAQNVVIQDQGTLPASNLRLTAASITLAPRQNVELEYDADIGDWVQVSALVAVL